MLRGHGNLDIETVEGIISNNVFQVANLMHTSLIP